jgi:hypothetical protein
VLLAPFLFKCLINNVKNKKNNKSKKRNRENSHLPFHFSIFRGFSTFKTHAAIVIFYFFLAVYALSQGASPQVKYMQTYRNHVYLFVMIKKKRCKMNIKIEELKKINVPYVRFKKMELKYEKIRIEFLYKKGCTKEIITYYIFEYEGKLNVVDYTSFFEKEIDVASVNIYKNLLKIIGETEKYRLPYLLGELEVDNCAFGIYSQEHGIRLKNTIKKGLLYWFLLPMIFYIILFLSFGEMVTYPLGVSTSISILWIMFNGIIYTTSQGDHKVSSKAKRMFIYGTCFVTSNLISLLFFAIVLGKH